MAVPKSREARRFFRAASHRYEEAQFLFTRYNTAAVYLAGYAVECILKALVLSNEPAARNAHTLAESFRGERAHDFDWLKARLAERRVHVPAQIAKEIARTNWWSTRLRYDPVELKRKDARTFLDAVGKIMQWAKGRL